MNVSKPGYPFSRELHVEGHLIDSGIMSSCMDLIIKNEGLYEIHEFAVGKSHEEPSRAQFTIFARTEPELLRLCEGLHGHGCQPVVEENIVMKPSTHDWVVPEDFYATTNHHTEVRIDGVWHVVKNQRMDAVLVCTKNDRGWEVCCRKFRDVRTGDQIACGIRGIRIKPESKERDREEFAFMNSEVSSERRVRIAVRKIAQIILEKRRTGGRLGITLGPVVVHTGGAEYLARMVREGYVDFILTGNATAVHDIEQNLYRTSLGIDIESGEPVEDGHRNHL
ncbi:MAG TPA: hypothetical protein PKM25_14495, partial [Candidatus Ozemobacteraceae bacterium]|nr:hypothetical protein [Candidatus Ozemobacteraceae bacterium]